MSVTRDNQVIRTKGGSSGTAQWTVTFNQNTIRVDKDDFQIVDANDVLISGVTLDVSATDGDSGDPEQATTYTVTATLPQEGYIADTDINLAISASNDILGSSDATSLTDFAHIRRPFGTTATTITSRATTPPTHYIYNPDTDGVVMTISRKDGAIRHQASRIDSENPAQVSWTITFDAPVSGVELDRNSTQFVMKLGDQPVRRSYASTLFVHVIVTQVSETEYTATFTLPQAFYAAPTVLNLVKFSGASFDSITQIDNFHNNKVDIADGEVILTDTSNNYEISTGAKRLLGITSHTHTQDDSRAVFTLDFGTRISSPR